MRKNANFANHKCALRRILLINMLKLKQLVSNLYHFAFGKEVHTNGMNADGTMSVAAGDPTLSVTPLKGLEMLPDRIPCENSMLDISKYKQSENPLNLLLKAPLCHLKTSLMVINYYAEK